MADNETASENTEGNISTEEFNKQRKMIDKLAIQVAKHTVEVTERDVVIETLRSMITPQQEQQAFTTEEE